MTNLKKLRQDRGLTQAEVCKLADINIRTYQSYEQGLKQINRIALEDGMKLAEVLRVDVKKIME